MLKLVVFEQAIRYSDVRTSLEEPKNDYFNSNILINFPHYGTYTIQVDLFILDDSDVIWRYICERQQITVKVEDDPNRQRLVAMAAAMAAAATSSTISSQPSSYPESLTSQERMMDTQ